jgi:integrase
LHITDLSIKALRLPETGAKTYFDDSLAGFGVRVSQGGTKSYILIHGKARTRVPLGRVGIITLKQARDKARDILAEKQLGRYQEATVTFSDALDLYIKNHVEKLKPKTQYETKRLLEKHFRPKLRHEKLVAINRANIAVIIGKLLDTPSVAVHAHTAITGFFRWATAQYLEQNPLIGLKPPAKQTSRSRVLTNDELKAIYTATADQGTFGKLVQLLILTGQRVNQIATLHADFIDTEKKTISWPGALMKGNKPHTIPYGKTAAAILKTLPEKGLLFPAKGKPDKPVNGFSKLKKNFDKACKVSDYTLHDIRRTFRTALASLKVPPHIGERILDHRTGIVSDVEAIYDRFQYIEEMRGAINLWERHLHSLLRRPKTA